MLVQKLKCIDFETAPWQWYYANERLYLPILVRMMFNKENACSTARVNVCHDGLD